ncbi:MAG: ATPase, T2SS/T4P/T4SS family [Acidobacteriota bacterium]
MAEALDAAVARLCRYLGDGVVGALSDPRTVEVYVNEDGDVRVAAEGQRRSTGEHLPPEQVRSFLRAAANWGGRHLEGAASLDVELPPGQPFDGARLHGEMPPTVRVPVFSIRVLPRRIYRLREYVDAGALGISGLTVLSTALTERWNVLVGGSTGSGKTTFLNAMLAELAERCPGDRLILLEDTFELQPASADVVCLRPVRGGLESKVRDTLRMHPDRIVLGEVRGREALALLSAWETGHPGGLATIHANDAAGALRRLDVLCQESGAPSQRERIGAAIDLVVMLQRVAGGRRVSEMVRVLGSGPDGFTLRPL